MEPTFVKTTHLDVGVTSDASSSRLADMHHVSRLAGLADMRPPGVEVAQCQSKWTQGDLQDLIRCCDRIDS